MSLNTYILLKSGQRMVDVIANKKLLIVVSFFLIYLFLYLVPGPYSLRFTVGLLFPVIILCASLDLKHVLPSFLSAVPIVLVIIVLVFTHLIPLSYTVLVKDAEIRETVNKLVCDISDPELKVREIMNWEKINITNMYRKSPIFLGLPSIWFRDMENPSWIFFYKRGCCAEYATLFVKMVEFADTEGRCVYNPAEDHRWAEVTIGGSWVQVDPSENKFINPASYENVRGIQMSYVYVIENVKVVDVTGQYTDTGRLIVRVMDDNELVAGVEVTVKSRFLMEKYPNIYDYARRIVPKDKQIFSTDKNGECIFNLGGNNYTIVAEFGGHKVENNITLEENKDNPITIYLPH